MLCWALAFLVLAVLAAPLGLGGAATAAGIAEILFFAFLVHVLALLVMHLVRGRPSSAA